MLVCLRQSVGLLLACGLACFVPQSLAEEPDRTAAKEATKPKAPLAAPPAETATELLRLHNAARQVHTKPSLRINETLNSAAQKFAQFMVQAKKYDHDADGRSAGQRIEAEGYNWATWSENIAWGSHNPREVFAGWMNSEGHRVNVLGDEQEVGFGFKDGVWVAVYASPLKPKKKD